MQDAGFRRPDQFVVPDVPSPRRRAGRPQTQPPQRFRLVTLQYVAGLPRQQIEQPLLARVRTMRRGKQRGQGAQERAVAPAHGRGVDRADGQPAMEPQRGRRARNRRRDIFDDDGIAASQRLASRARREASVAVAGLRQAALRHGPECVGLAIDDLNLGRVGAASEDRRVDHVQQSVQGISIAR